MTHGLFTFIAALNAAYLMDAQCVILECTPLTVNFPDTKRALESVAGAMGFRIFCSKFKSLGHVDAPDGGALPLPAMADILAFPSTPSFFQYGPIGLDLSHLNLLLPEP